MGAAEKKFVIGLTGNIATGKSVVRKMLEHLGAYGIDADALSHRIIAKGMPGYQAVVDEFGKYILDGSGEIERGKLGNLVFSDQDALGKLEAIVHPLVRKAVDHLVKNARQKIIVVEAIKLLESPLKEKTDSIWVVTAPEEDQFERLAEKRGMSKDEAENRMANQSPQSEKIAAADVVIANDRDFEETWIQVQEAWQEMFPNASTGDTVVMEAVQRPEAAAQVDLASAELVVLRAGPRQAEEIAEFITRMSEGRKKLSRMDIMASFGEKAYMLLMADEVLAGIIGWQVENLVARTDEVWLDDGLDKTTAIKTLMDEVESASRELQAEAALVFVDEKIAEDFKVWRELGYEARTPDSLSVTAWKESAYDVIDDSLLLLFKQLRVDRVLRPI